MCTRMEWSNAGSVSSGSGSARGLAVQRFTEMEIADHILERGLWSSSGLVVQDNSAKYVSGPVRVLNVSAFGNVCAPGA
jgi:hypothetical protein